MSTAIQKQDQFAKLDALAKEAYHSLMQADGGFVKANALAVSMNQLRAALQPMMKDFMPLQNSPLGFKTDNAAGYPEDVVRDSIIEATLRGVQPVGNQFNIISSRCYITREGYEYKLKNLEGLSDLKIDLGVPKMAASGEGAIVECRATWKYKGKEDSKQAEIPVRVNKGMGIDAILGKADRKFRKRVFEQITGSNEADEADGEGFENAKPVKATVSDAPKFSAAQKEMPV